MVAANRPWLLLPGLSSALAAALATSAFGIVTSTLWMLAPRLRPARLILAMLASVTVMLVWLILDHGPWERAGDEHGLTAERAAFYNAATVLTLAAGVGLAYACLLVLDLAMAAFLIDSGVFAPAGRALRRRRRLPGPGVAHRVGRHSGRGAGLEPGE